MFMGSVSIISADSSKSCIKEIINIYQYTCMYIHKSFLLFYLGGGGRGDCLILSGFVNFFNILRTVIVLRWSTTWRVAL